DARGRRIVLRRPAGRHGAGFRLPARGRRRFPRRLPAHRGTSQGHAIRRARASVPALPARPLRRVQPGLRPRHPLRPAERRPRRIDPDEPAAAGALGVRLRARTGQHRGAPGRLPGAARLAGGNLMPTMDAYATQLQANLDAIRARIDAACRAAGRDPGEVRLLPVSKTVDAARLRQAHGIGLRELGENKVQEAMGKWEAMADLADLRWVLIGHLQTNKAKYAARFASEFQALDSLRVAEALDAQLQSRGRALDVLVQVNTSGEATKFGLAPEEVDAF